MKTKLTLLTFLFSVLVFAQNGINYKAIIKDNGNVIVNQAELFNIDEKNHSPSIPFGKRNRSY